jgi:subfamily B ATP-binding cassette protein HlyB/CyaB
MMHSGPACLVRIARAHGLVADAAQLMHEFADGCEFSTSAMLHAAHKIGLLARRIKPPLTRLSKMALPAVVPLRTGGYTLLLRVEQNEEDVQLMLQAPSDNTPKLLSLQAFEAQWQGELILFASQASIASELARFDFSWFIPVVVRYRRLLLEVLLVSAMLQVFALVTPLFFQVVMDKVLVHRGWHTLNVIAVGLFMVSVFEVLLAGLRSYVFSHTCSRIDVELGARLFRHVLSLPISWFHARRTGDTVARLRELENIRSFLTGNGMTLVLDLLFSVVFIAVMLLYSGSLTLLVLLSLPCYLLLSLIATPMLRRRLDQQFRRNAENQALLIETVSAIDTVKAMALEPRWCRKWEDQLAAYLRAAFATHVVGTIASQGVALIGKLVTLGCLWQGARLVINAELSIGQLVAFNMLASHVASPVMRLAQMWSDFQQVGVSIERLGEILNAPSEQPNEGLAFPRIHGHIQFEHLHFGYQPEGREILQDLHFEIRPGEIIGIVGRSGSGKSTLTRLLQRLYLPQRGRILIDGIDIALADPASLRRQIGVVLQDSQLFNGTVRENIALADPGAPFTRVMHAAQLAHAHEFISNLPAGYQTRLGEHGTGLSGGQKQRIAIARALMRDPRILIFDEATSALDYESERVIQMNMAAICRDRSVIIIAHRLSSVRQADRIIVMDQGRLVEQGQHTDLLNRAHGLYAHLYGMQQA